MLDQASIIVFSTLSDLYAFAHLPISVTKCVKSRFDRALYLWNTLDILNSLKSFRSQGFLDIIDTYRDSKIGQVSGNI